MLLLIRCPCSPYTQVFRDVWSNRFLFWAVVGGSVSVFPLICTSVLFFSLQYLILTSSHPSADIPKLNTVVFLHSPISWELAVAFISLLVFMILCDAWKYAKRVYLRRNGDEEKVQEGIFSAWQTSEVTMGGAEAERKV